MSAPARTEIAMTAKRVMLVVLVVFLGFWMFTDPRGLADAARSGAAQVWDLSVQLFDAVIAFLGALT
jgi:hypothetical protein